MTASLFPTGPLTQLTSMSQASRKSMRRSQAAVRKVGVIEPQIFAQRIAAFLRLIHPQKTAACVEADTRIPAKTVSKWLEGASSPAGKAYHQLLAVYGMELFYYVDPDASTAEVREAARICQQARLERQNAELQRRLAGQMAEIWGPR
ncbi:hypothetical protein ACLBX9_09655 [Methylobacterium sp. A49B]